MVEVNWTDQSIDDVRNIAEYIAIHSEKYASIQVERFFDSTAILSSNPLSGRIVPEINRKTIRELILGNYRIIYRIVSANRVDILTVHHGAMLLENSPVFRKRKKK